MKLNVDDSIKDNSFHAFSKASAPCVKFVYPFFLLFLLDFFLCAWLVMFSDLTTLSRHTLLCQIVQRENFFSSFFASFRESIICFLPLSDYPFTELPSCSYFSCHIHTCIEEKKRNFLWVLILWIKDISISKEIFFELISFINLLKK